MIEEHGRKYAMTILGIACTVGLATLGVVVAALVPAIGDTVGTIVPITIGSVAGMVATFITGNSAVSFAYAKSDASVDSRTVNTTTSRTITERRDADAGVEPSP